MRSRLEARYAQWLDKQNWAWQYEPDCFADDTGQYLPDFLVGLDDYHIYVEIKPVLTKEVVIDVAPRMERIFASEPFAGLMICAPSKAYGFDIADTAEFYKGDWWLEMVGAGTAGNTLVWSSGRA